MHHADRIDRLLALFALAAPAAYLLLLGVRPYSGDTLLKSSLCLLLAILACRYGKQLLVVALLFSAIGDALLSIDATKLFVPALASFLATHLLYAAIFSLSPKLQVVRLRFWRFTLLALVPVFAIVYTAILWPKLGSLAWPVAAYIAAIVAMTVLSLRVPVTIVPIGAALFLISDSLIALGKFLWHATWIGQAIWITYAAAQLAITYGLLSTTRRDRLG